MLSDCAPPFVLAVPATPYPDEAPFEPLNFDDLLDIACEFEFTRTITHIWPCEEEHTCTETELDDILATIVTIPNTKESLVSSPTSTLLTTVDQVEEVDLRGSASVCLAADANPCISTDLVSLSKHEDHLRAESGTPIISNLQGWSPPNGSQFLELDDSLMLPQPAKDVWNPPWLSMVLANSFMQPVDDVNQSFAKASATDDVQPQTSAIMPNISLVSTTDQTVDDPNKKSVLTGMQHSSRATLEPVGPPSTAQTNSNIPSQMVATPHTKTPKSRSHLPSALATKGTSTANYGRAPRGGIPPHIARSVTKANILRIEKERKVMQDAFSSTTTGEAKKPSVLRRTAKVEREASKMTSGGDSGKKLFDWEKNDEKDGRTAKRVRV